MAIFDFFRRRYRVLLHGSGIIIPAEDGSVPIVGFLTVRFVRAGDPHLASSMTVNRVRNDWFNSPWSMANRSGGPVLVVRDVQRVRNPFRRSRPRSGYRFYREGDEVPAEMAGGEDAGGNATRKGEERWKR